MPFVKGQSGNPTGRPKGDHAVKRAAMGHGIEAVEKLVELMRGDDLQVALKASTALLDRGYGRPHQSIEHSGHIETALAEDLTDADLARIASAGSDGAITPPSGPSTIN